MIAKEGKFLDTTKSIVYIVMAIVTAVGVLVGMALAYAEIKNVTRTNCGRIDNNKTLIDNHEARIKATELFAAQTAINLDNMKDDISKFTNTQEQVLKLQQEILRKL